MANVFTFTITAVDKATAIVRGINNSVARLTAPIARVGAAGKDLSREMGIGKLNHRLKETTQSARDLAEGMRRIIGPTAAIAGIAGLGGLATAAAEWGRAGTSLYNSSRTIGMSTDRLQEFQGAARMVGMSAEELTGGMASLGDSMNDALYGRNLAGSQMLSILGMKLAKTKSGTVDVEQGFNDLRDALQRYENMPQTQATIARAFGAEQLLPLLRASKEEFAGYIEEARKAHAILPADDARKFDQTIRRLDLSLLGLRNTLMLKLAPIAAPVIKRLSDQLDSIDPEEAGRRIDGFTQRVGNFVQAIGGWSTVGYALAGLFGARVIGNVAYMGYQVGRLGFAAGGVALRGVLALGTGLMQLGRWVGPLALRSLPWLVRGIGLVAGAIGAIGVGPVIAGLTVLAGLAYVLIENWKPIAKFFTDLWSGIVDTVEKAVNRIRSLTSPSAGWTKEELDLGGFKAAPNQKFLGRFLKPGESAPQAQPAAPAPAPGGFEAAPNQPFAGFKPVKRMAAHPAEPPLAGRQPLGLRQNNPGNLRSWGNTPTAGGYAQFPTAFEGLSAMTGNLMAYAKRGWNSIDSIVSHWAPKSENDTEAYKAKVAARMGVAPGAALDMRNPLVIRSLEQAMITQEQGKQPFSSELLESAIADRFQRMGIAPQGQAAQAPAGQPAAAGQVNVHVSFDNAPAGVRTNVDSHGPVSTNTQIGYAMPGFATP